MMEDRTRQVLYEARLAGDNDTVQKICMMGLSGLLSDINLNVHIAGEDVEVH